jgi:hypothetical protein
MREIGILAVILSCAGCYHATVDTGRTPSPQTIEKRWASGWILGLVPPATLQTAQQCPNGIARVSTQLSFPNQLVSFLTAGIYTPMEIVVTCAAAGSASLAPSGQNVGDSPEAVLAAAIDEVRRTHGTVLVQMRTMPAAPQSSRRSERPGELMRRD